MSSSVTNTTASNYVLLDRPLRKRLPALEHNINGVTANLFERTASMMTEPSDEYTSTGKRRRVLTEKESLSDTSMPSTTLQSLPVELMSRVLENLPLSDLAQIGRICRGLRKAVDNELCRPHFIEIKESYLKNKATFAHIADFYTRCLCSLVAFVKERPVQQGVDPLNKIDKKAFKYLLDQGANVNQEYSRQKRCPCGTMYTERGEKIADMLIQFSPQLRALFKEKLPALQNETIHLLDSTRIEDFDLPFFLVFFAPLL